MRNTFALLVVAMVVGLASQASAQTPDSKSDSVFLDDCRAAARSWEKQLSAQLTALGYTLIVFHQSGELCHLNRAVGFLGDPIYVGIFSDPAVAWKIEFKPCSFKKGALPEAIIEETSATQSLQSGEAPDRWKLARVVPHVCFDERVEISARSPAGQQRYNLGFSLRQNLTIAELMLGARANDATVQLGVVELWALIIFIAVLGMATLVLVIVVVRLRRAAAGRGRISDTSSPESSSRDTEVGSSNQHTVPLHEREDQRGDEREPRPSAPLIQKRIILFLAANPSGTDRIALDQEARSIQMELEASGYRDRFEFETRWAAQPLDLLRALRKLKPTVVHYSGHGDQNGLFFQAPDGSAQLMPTKALEKTFGAAGTSVKLVVLNACYSEVQAEALLAHVDCVVGMSGPIPDHDASNFAIGFYGALGERTSVQTAYQQGCAAMEGQLGSNMQNREVMAARSEAQPPRIEGERAQLKVRAGVDASQLVLAADPR